MKATAIVLSGLWIGAMMASASALECAEKIFPDTPSQIQQEIAQRLAPLGYKEVLTETNSSAGIYKFRTADYNFSIMAMDMGKGISMASASDINGTLDVAPFVAMTAYLASRFSGLPELSIAEKIKAGISSHKVGEAWHDLWDTTTVNFSIMEDRHFVSTVGRLDCN